MFKNYRYVVDRLRLVLNIEYVVPPTQTMHWIYKYMVWIFVRSALKITHEAIDGMKIGGEERTRCLKHYG